MQIKVVVHSVGTTANEVKKEGDLMDNIPELFYPKGELKKKYDEIIVTGEVYRANTNPKQLKSTDKHYSIAVKISAESFKTLFKGSYDTSVWDDESKSMKVTVAGNRKLTGLKQVNLKKIDEEGNEVLDELDMPVKEFSHYQLTMKQNKEIRKEGAVTQVEIPVICAKTGEHLDKFLQEGSKVSVLGQAFESEYEGKKYLSLNLKEVRVHEGIYYEGGGSTDHDPWATLGLAQPQAAVNPSDKTVSQEPNNQAANSDQQQNTTPPQNPSQPDFDDFDDDIPF